MPTFASTASAKLFDAPRNHVRVAISNQTEVWFNLSASHFGVDHVSTPKTPMLRKAKMNYSVEFPPANGRLYQSLSYLLWQAPSSALQLLHHIENLEDKGQMFL